MVRRLRDLHVEALNIKLKTTKMGSIFDKFEDVSNNGLEELAAVKASVVGGPSLKDAIAHKLVSDEQTQYARFIDLLKAKLLYFSFAYNQFQLNILNRLRLLFQSFHESTEGTKTSSQTT